MPWYVAHGDIIAWLLVAAVAIAPLGVVWLVRALRDRTQARRDRARFEVGSRAPTEGPITVRGILRGGSATTTTAAAGSTHARPEILWLEHEGERIDLVGDVHVVRGTRTKAGWRSRHHEVSAGDPVIVRGTASRTTSSYREQTWKLEPDGELTPIELCASRPASRGTPIAPAWIAALLVVFGVGGYFGLRWLGARQLDSLNSARYDTRPPMSWTNAAALAVMLPGQHDRALAYLWALYGGVIERSQENLDARVEIAERLRGRMRWLVFPDDTPPTWTASACEAGAIELVRQARFEQALARGCKSARIEPEANLALGRYAEAGGSEDAMARGLVELAAGRYAAVGVQLGESRTCVALLARVLVDDAAAIDELRERATKDESCAISLALAHPPAERAARLAAIDVDDEDARSAAYKRELIADLRWALDPTFDETPEGVLDDEVSRFMAGMRPNVYRIDERESLLRSLMRRTWLSTMAPETARDVHAYRALAAMTRGDFAAARTEVAASGRADLGASLAVREQPNDRKLTNAVDQDGRKQAQRIRTSSLGWTDLRAWILENGAAVSDHREDLQRAVRVLVADSFLPPPTETLSFIHEAAVIRDAHRAVGDASETARWQSIIDRHLAAFADPQKRLLLVLLAR